MMRKRITPITTDTNVVKPPKIGGEEVYVGERGDPLTLERRRVCSFSLRFGASASGSAPRQLPHRLALWRSV